MQTLDHPEAEPSLSQPIDGQRRLGFLQGLIAVPEDFDRMGEAEIADLFDGL